MAKTSKSGKANRKLVSVGMTVVVVAIVLIVAIFFTYISGVLPRTLTGIQITETVDGKETVIKNFNVLESNYHFVEVYDSYSQYGMVSADKLDTVCNEETGETYRDVLLREAATQMRTLALVERAAKENGFMEISKARELAAANLTTLDLYGMMYGYGSGMAYLRALYGTGMTKRSYTDFTAREILVEEYGNYLKQFDTTIVPTDEAVKAKYNEAPNQYSTVDYSSYFIKAETDKDGNVIGMDAAVASANKIAKAAKDTASFRQAVIDYATEKKDDAVLATFADDKNPCLTEGFTYSLSTYMDAAVRDYIYIEDLAKVFVQLIEKDVKNTTLNIGSGRGYSVNDVLAFLKIVTQKDFKINYRDPRPVDVSNMVLDLRNLKQYVDIKFTPFMEGIKAFYEESKKV